MIIFIALLTFTARQNDIQAALIPFDRRAYQDLKQYFVLAFPGYVMISLEWWAWEFMVLISGLLGVEQ